MYSYRYTSKTCRTGLCLATLLLMLFASCSRTKTQAGSLYAYDSYCVVSDGTDGGERWAEYLYNHLNRRTGRTGIIRQGEPAGKNNLHIVVGTDPDAAHAYAIDRHNNRLTLTARDNEAMLWLLYQFMAAAAHDDNHISAPDLPPAMLNMNEAQAGDFAFEYRGLYTHSNADNELMPITASHNPDYDWGLWGHNLHKLFGGEVPQDAQAQVKGKHLADQFCFSSERLYRTIEQFILDEFSEKEGTRFMLMPQDNDIVCTCLACTRAGNTPKTATPAVTRLLERLAQRFPQHLFFTSSYLTTLNAPASPLPANTGVMISAMDIPLKADFRKSPQARRFKKLLERWKKVTTRIYVWDYMRNFDDYLTPYPCLGLMKDRMLHLCSLGVKGIFLNGSGNDYASLDDVQTYVLSCLLVNPDCSTDSCAARYLQHFYPVTGEMLTEHYLDWEAEVRRSKAALPFYGGIDDAVKAWLDEEKFTDFIGELDRKSKKAKDEERTRLNRLLTALQFTRLELMRRPQGKYDTRQAADCLELLEGHEAFDDMQHYREANGRLDIYIDGWRTLMAENATPADKLNQVQLAAGSKLDRRYTDLNLLTDGKYALPTDYHTGWLINSAKQLVLEVPAGSLQSGDLLEFSLLSAPRWRILLPAHIEIEQKGEQPAGSVTPPAAETAAPFTKYKVKCKVGKLKPELPVQIRITQSGAHKRATLAMDEIDVF